MYIDLIYLAIFGTFFVWMVWHSHFGDNSYSRLARESNAKIKELRDRLREEKGKHGALAEELYQLECETGKQESLVDNSQKYFTVEQWEAKQRTEKLKRKYQQK